MREITLFVEDNAHKVIVGALIHRIAEESQISVELDWYNTTGGYGKVVQESKEYLRDLQQQQHHFPDLVVIATDTNCIGRQKRIQEINAPPLGIPLVYALPEPHIERWLLLDGAAFKAVCGKGCNAPDLKCNRGRYKTLLVDAIYAAGLQPQIGGIELADDIIAHMNLRRAQQADTSFRHFAEDLYDCFQSWKN